MVVKNLWNEKGKMLLKLCDRCFTLVGWLFVLGILWLLLQITSFASFRIPTASMEPTLIPGDYILVNKWIMGARIFDVFDAVEGKEVEIRRFPGVGKIQRNDVVVFNFPHYHRWDSIGMDMMVYYVKRCIGIPGDSVMIRNAHYQEIGVKDTLGYLPTQNKFARLLDLGDTERMPIALESFPEDTLVDWNI